MPESKVRKKAEGKKKAQQKAELAEQRAETARLSPQSRNWVPAVAGPVGLLGALWLTVYNLAGDRIGFMTSLGEWNFVIAIVLIIGCLSLFTLWK